MSVLPWYRDKFAAFDIESTGINPHEDRIITAAVVYMAGILRPKIRTWVIDSGHPIAPEASAVNGWTQERIDACGEARDPEPAIFEIVGSLGYMMSKGIPVVAANASFDLTMLEAEATRHGIDPLSTRLPHGVRPVLDPQVLDKQVAPYRPAKCDGLQKRAPRCTCGAVDKKLPSLCLHYGVPFIEQHQAHTDAIAAARLVTRIVEKHPELASCSLDELHDGQVQWRAEQMDSLRAYFDRQGTPHDRCCGEWPIHTACAPVAQEALL